MSNLPEGVTQADLDLFYYGPRGPHDGPDLSDDTDTEQSRPTRAYNGRETGKGVDDEQDDYGIPF